MSKKALESLHRINYLTAEIDALYHQASLKLGLSDSAMRTLYTIYDQGSKGEECLLSDIYKQSGIQKQTVNSAIRRLESEGICYLAPNDGRGKKVCLTEKGKAYIRPPVCHGVQGLRLLDRRGDRHPYPPDGEIRRFIPRTAAAATMKRSIVL